ncbi:hypothetical protein JCM24511_01635 [Saitozyma sp. JCM 24511]|nr:hypothetical protein JCM24511_01635 [Saitozyma sp. JCM 24511]
MPPRRNPLRKAQEPGSSDSDDSVEVAHTHAIKRPRSIPRKKVETAHDHTVTKSFSDYRPKRGAARKPKYEEEGDEDWSQIQRKTGGRGKKEEKTEVVPFAGEEASSSTTSSSTALSSPASETPDDVSASSKLGSATTPTESSTKVDKGGTEVKELSAKAMEDRKKREKMLSALEGRMKGDWKGKKVSGKLRRQYGFWGGA